MPRRARTAREIAAWFILFYTAAALLLGLAVYLIGDRALRAQLDERIRVEAEYLGEAYAHGGPERLRELLQGRDDRGVNNLGYLLRDARGETVGGELRTAPPPDGWRDIEFRDGEGQIATARALTVSLADGYRLTVATELAPTIALRRTTTLLIGIMIALMIAGGIGFGILFSSAIRSRLISMNDTALAIIGGDHRKRVDVGPVQDEFGRLSVTLNRMLDRNDRLIENLRQVSSDIAHDLRTPLARLRQRLERAQLLAGNTPQTAREIEIAIEQADAILSLFAALLRISEVESRSLRQYFRLFDLSAAVRSLGESYAAVAEDGGRVLECDIAEQAILWGDEELISQALVNLLENALRHTPPGTRVTMTLNRMTAGIRLTIRDDGAGVPAELLPTLTQRFTRSDAARTSPGFGLGLNLVQAIIDSHDGTLTLENLPGGFAARIDLPLTESRE